MDFRHLSNFVQIVDAGSLTRAAGMVGVAQPALTFQIARLEQELECQLLIRSTRGVYPTEAGMILYREAQSILRHLQDVPQLVRNPAIDPSGDVTIGFPNSLTPYFSTSVVAAVQEKLPRVRLRIFEGESVVQREQIMRNRVEVALICEHVPAADLHHRLLFKQRLAFLCDGRDSRDRDGDPIELVDAVGRISGLPNVGNPVRAALDTATQKLGLSIDVRVEYNAVRTLISAVGRGLGASINLWMPMQDVDDGQGIVTRPIIKPHIWLEVSLCRSKLHQPTPAAVRVEEIMAEVALDRISCADWQGAVLQESVG